MDCCDDSEAASIVGTIYSWSAVVFLQPECGVL